MDCLLDRHFSRHGASHEYEEIPGTWAALTSSPPSHPHTSSFHSSHNIPLTENQPLSGHGGDLSEGSSCQEHDPHAQALPQGLQLFP